MSTHQHGQPRREPRDRVGSNEIKTG